MRHANLHRRMHQWVQWPGRPTRVRQTESYSIPYVWNSDSDWSLVTDLESYSVMAHMMVLHCNETCMFNTWTRRTLSIFSQVVTYLVPSISLSLISLCHCQDWLQQLPKQTTFKRHSLVLYSLAPLRFDTLTVLLKKWWWWWFAQYQCLFYGRLLWLSLSMALLHFSISWTRSNMKLCCFHLAYYLPLTAEATIFTRHCKPSKWFG